MTPWLTVVGIGEDGFKGLGKLARRALLGATRIVGGQRQLDLLPACIRGERQLWPSPFSLEPLLAQRGARRPVDDAVEQAGCCRSGCRVGWHDVRRVCHRGMHLSAPRDRRRSVQAQCLQPARSR